MLPRQRAGYPTRNILLSNQKYIPEMETCHIPAVRFPASSLQHRFNQSIKKPSNLQVCSNHIISNNKNGTQKRMFILGMGYVGQFVAQHFINQGWDVSGTCKSIAKMEKLNDKGFDVLLFDANIDPPYKLEVVDILNEYTHILVSIPPCKVIGDPMLLHVDLLKTRINNERLQWLCYLSTTGVYGDCGGAWVDENYQPNPPTELLKLRLAAEEGWLSLGHDLGFAAHVFRLGGIYGPGRSAIDTIIKKGAISDVQRGRSFKKYTSRVHVADICNALNESIHKPSPGRIYNIVDDDPAPRTEVFSYAHKLISEKWPSEIKKVASPATNELLTGEVSLRGEKRVVNERMKKELGVRLLHPSYKSGLQSICDQMHNYPISSPRE